MNAIDLLEIDHRLVLDLFKKIEDLKDENPALRESLFVRIKTELSAHEAIEEEFLYPALASNEKTKDIVLESYQEHHVADLQIEEIAKLSATDEVWNAKVKVLKETIEHHIDEEEFNLFPKGKTALSAEQLENLGELMEDRKSELLPAAA